MKRSLCLTFTFLFLLTLPARGQMFSVGDSEQEYFNPYAPYLRAGLSTVDFNFNGDNSQVFSSDRYDFEGNALFIGFESAGLYANLTMANKLTGQTDQSFFQLGITFNNPFIFVRKPDFSLGIPLQLSSLLTSVNKNETNDEFGQTGLSAGAGLIMQARSKKLFSLTTEFVPSYGFSSSSGGFFGGSVFSLDGKLRLNFYDMLFGKNISLGFDYKTNSYDIDGEEFDYDLQKLTFSLGVSL